MNAQNEPTSPWWHLIPIAGFFLSRGRSRYRNEPVGGWGLFVELGTGLLFAGFVVAMRRSPPKRDIGKRKYRTLSVSRSPAWTTLSKMFLAISCSNPGRSWGETSSSHCSPSFSFSARKGIRASRRSRPRSWQVENLWSSLDQENLKSLPKFEMSRIFRISELQFLMLMAAAAPPTRFLRTSSMPSAEVSI